MSILCAWSASCPSSEKTRQIERTHMVELPDGRMRRCPECRYLQQQAQMSGA